MAGALWDASPDSWGQRVIIARLTGIQGRAADNVELDKLTYLLESGSNRIGALDFQASPTEYLPREDGASLDQLHEAALALDAGELSPSLAAALVHGTSVGGARPKVTLTDGDRHLIAKFSRSTDTFPMVKAEAAGMDLARRAGIEVPATELITSLGREVLLIERFDRPGGGRRRMMLSGLTLLGFGDFLGARYSAYPDLLDVLRQRAPRGTNPNRTMFERIVFNIAIGNTDDHARNHAAFWNGTHLELTPAYDLSPQPRSGTEERQAMDIGRDGSRNAQFAVCVAAAPDYGLTRAQAREIVDRQVGTIRDSWDEVADAARMTTLERTGLYGRQILNPYAFLDYEPRVHQVPGGVPSAGTGRSG
ncbi:MAG: HipA domain-containing protein [Actinobacteria bacterium]|nr:HipA domain-containing protein [Actinomycetota bacterium]